jgi:hypothetical protein
MGNHPKFSLIIYFVAEITIPHVICNMEISMVGRLDLKNASPSPLPKYVNNAISYQFDDFNDIKIHYYTYVLVK